MEYWFGANNNKILSDLNDLKINKSSILFFPNIFILVSIITAVVWCYI